jgi:hypothetical protein
MNDDLTGRIEAQPLAAVIDYYAERLPANPRAIGFLERHRLTADAKLRVGFADRTLGAQLPAKTVRAGRAVRRLLQETGILRANGREQFRGLVTVPLTCLQGNVTGIYGLRIDPSHGEPETTLGRGLFNAAALHHFDEIILCASVLDAWTFCGAGYKHAVAVVDFPLTSELFDKAKRVLLAGPFSHDLFQGRELLRIVFPEGVSVHEYALQSQSVDDSLGKRIRAAEWISGSANAPAACEETAAKDMKEQEEKLAPVTSQTPLTSPAPLPLDDLDVETSELETTIRIEDRRWRVRGLQRNTTLGVMRVNVMLHNQRSDRFHVDQLDLYHARSRRVFLKEAAEETALSEHDLRADLARVLMKLEQLQHQQLSSEKAEKKRGQA